MLNAQQGEHSRILVHTLTYISHDYQFAVKDGKIINEEEYDEALEFAEASVKYYKEYAPDWSLTDSIEIGKLIYRLDSLMEHRAAFKIVSPLAIEIKKRVIAASGLQIIPTTYPNLQNGKIIYYKAGCASCHGETGNGDGAAGKALEPKPRNFMSEEQMKSISPFAAFNTTRLGVEGTGMAGYPTLTDKEVWDVSFFILSMRYQSLQQNPFLKEPATMQFLDSLSAGEVATSSDEDFRNKFGLADSSSIQLTLAALRLHQPVADGSKYISTSLNYLDGAIELYKQGKHLEALQLATLSYLEGIEPIELQLKATDPNVMVNLENQMQRLRKMIEEQRPFAEVSDSLQATRTVIESLNGLLKQKSHSFWLTFLLAGSVLLREGLEAFLVIMVILSILKATELKHYRRWIHSGWIAAVLVGVGLWLLGGKLVQEQVKHVELIEGVISVVAVLMLLYVGFWLHRHSEIGKWKEYINKWMNGMVSRNSLLGLAALSFFVVFREVFESVIFLSALNIEAGGKQSNAIALGVICAFVVVLVLAWVVLAFSAKLPLKAIFKISSLVMGGLAVVLTGKAVHSFQVINYLPIHGVPIPRIELLGIFPTMETCGAQLAVLLVVAMVWKLTIGKK